MSKYQQKWDELEKNMREMNKREGEGGGKKAYNQV